MRRLAPLALCAVALAACSGGGEERGSATLTGGGDEPSLAGAVERMTAERANFSLDAVLEGESVGDGVELSAVGTTDLRADRSSMELDFSQLAEAGGAQTDPDDWRGQAVYDRDTVFIRLPGLTKALPEAVEWLSVDPGALAEQGGPQFSAPDPREFVMFVDAIAADAEAVGEEEVRNARTTHFRGTVEVEELSEWARPGDRAQMESYASRLRAAGLQTFPLDVWLGEDGVIRRLRSTYNGFSTGATKLSITTTVEFYDFGTEKAILRPRPSEVTPLDELIGRGAAETEHTEPEGA